ncbi:hypothetical protein Leryth_026097 [Lithospermum erythrorhizon]|nr:hypothetical protein Leryth_026097 [Lithospermum erythrorhizon]
MDTMNPPREDDRSNNVKSAGYRYDKAIYNSCNKANGQKEYNNPINPNTLDSGTNNADITGRTGTENKLPMIHIHD